MSKKPPLYEGKAKIIFEGPEPGTLIQHFKDDATAFNAQKKGIISGKGVMNNKISEYIMVSLEEAGIPTHFLKSLNMREQLVKACDIVPIEVVMRNYAAGSLCKRLNIPEGMKLSRTLIEFYYKNDDLGDPLVTEEHIIAFEWAMAEELEIIKILSLRINDFLTGLFRGVGIRLIDFKLEFGRLFEGDRLMLVVADEISPDSCRLWDMQTNEKLDKDRFRHDMGGVEEAYQEIARRLGVMPDSSVVELGKKGKKK
jgi:phosphoribosylaminoimidazole-succinocarboxamide synthase